MSILSPYYSLQADAAQPDAAIARNLEVLGHGL